MESVPGDESHTLLLLLLYCYSASEILIKHNSGFMVYSSESVSFPNLISGISVNYWFSFQAFDDKWLKGICLKGSDKKH